jgi:Transposase
MGPLTRMLDDHDPTNEIGAAWGVKERLRMLLAESEPSKIRRRLADFYHAAIDARLPEASRLAKTIQTGLYLLEGVPVTVCAVATVAWEGSPGVAVFG